MIDPQFNQIILSLHHRSTKIFSENFLETSEINTLNKSRIIQITINDISYTLSWDIAEINTTIKPQLGEALNKLLNNSNSEFNISNELKLFVGMAHIPILDISIAEGEHKSINSSFLPLKTAIKENQLPFELIESSPFLAYLHKTRVIKFHIIALAMCIVKFRRAVHADKAYRIYRGHFRQINDILYNNLTANMHKAGTVNPNTVNLITQLHDLLTQSPLYKTFSKARAYP